MSAEQHPRRERGDQHADSESDEQSLEHTHLNPPPRAITIGSGRAQSLTRRGVGPYHPAMPSPKFSSTRSAGLLIAAAVALILAGVVLMVALNHRPAKPTPTQTGDVTDINAAQMPDPPVDGALVPGRDGRWQFTRKDDPNKLQAEVLYRRMNPVGPGAYELTEPRAWIYMEDGRALFVRADGGRLKGQAATQQAESGEFVGNVVILLFPTRTGEAALRPRDPQVDRPALVARTRAIRFDTLLLEFATDDPFEILTPQARFDGVGLIVRGNQVLDRIEYLHVASGGVIRYHVVQSQTDRQQDEGWEIAGGASSNPTPPQGPKVARAEGDAQAAAGGREPAARQPVVPIVPEGGADVAASAPAVGSTKSLKEDLYRAVFAGDVRLTQKRRLLTADTLLVWLRTLDNKLPEGAFGEVESVAAANGSRSPAHAGSPHDAALPGVSLPWQAVVPALALSATGQQPVNTDWPPRLFEPGPADIELTWGQSLTVRPINAGDGTPRELARGNNLALRFTAEAPGGADSVSLTDAAIGAKGACAELEYLATRRELALAGGAGSPRVWLAAPEFGCLVGPRLSVNLSTGAAAIPGAGQLAGIAESSRLVAMAPDADGLPAFMSRDDADWLDRRIMWADRADLQFRVADGEIHDALEWADFFGRAVAQDSRSSLAGDAIRAEFIEHGDEPMLISRLRVDGDVEALAEGWVRPPGVDVQLVGPDFGEGVLHAASLDVKFEPSNLRAGQADPVYLIARGDAAAGRGDSALFAPVLEAWLVRDEQGDVAVGDFEARADAQGAETRATFKRADGVRASAERIRGNAQRQTATLTGRSVEVARDESIITTTIVELDGVKGTMAVFAPGAFTHEQPLAGGGGDARTRVAAEWSGSMLYDDAARTLDCQGDTVVVRTEPLLTDTIRGQRLRIDFAADSDAAPAAAQSAEAPTADPAGLDVEGLNVTRATVYGAIDDEPRDPAPLAKVESRRYAAAAGGQRTLETVSYIESPVLIADDEQGTFRSPAAGRAIVFDQREPEAAQAAADSGDTLASPRGTSSFRWAESMLFTRATGVLELDREIEVVHKPIGDGPIARMTGDRLVATLDLAGGGSRLLAANAAGSVYAESGPQRLVAESVNYDAARGVLVAEAMPAGTVTLFDDRRATPFTARKLRWDLIRDEVEILEPAAIIAPR